MKLKTELWDRVEPKGKVVNICGIAEDFAHIIAAAFQRNKAACCQFCFHFQVVWDFNAVVVLLCIKPVSFKTCPLCQFHYEGEKSAMAKAVWGIWEAIYTQSVRMAYLALLPFQKKTRGHQVNIIQTASKKHVTAAQNRVHDNNKEIKRVALLASPPNCCGPTAFKNDFKKS